MLSLSNIGPRLQQRRIDKGYRSAKALATECELHGIKVGEATIKNIEAARKKQNPRIDTIVNLCNILTCTPDYLLGESDYPTPDHEMIAEYTGLSIKAIDTLDFLKAMDMQEELELISTIISSPFFLTAIQNYIKAASFKREDKKIKSDFQGRKKDNDYYENYGKAQGEFLDKRGIPNLDIGISDTADFYNLSADKYLLASLRDFKKQNDLT